MAHALIHGNAAQMRALLRLVSIAAIAAALLGCIFVALALAGLYVVSFSGIEPGDYLGFDTLAPTVPEAIQQLAIGSGIIAIALCARALIRRKLRTQRDP